MKKVLLGAMLVFSVMAQAHTSQLIQKLKNPRAQAAYMAASELLGYMNEGRSGSGGGVVDAAYKITKINPEPKTGESDEAVMTRVLKAVLHRDYPITGDDGGYGFEKVNAQNEKYVEHQLSESFYIMDEELAQKMALVQALVAAGEDENLVVLLGGGSGNNTSASIVAVLDLKNKELFYMMSSNFGSDD